MRAEVCSNYNYQRFGARMLLAKSGICTEVSYESRDFHNLGHRGISICHERHKRTGSRNSFKAANQTSELQPWSYVPTLFVPMTTAVVVIPCLLILLRERVLSTHSPSRNVTYSNSMSALHSGLKPHFSKNKLAMLVHLLAKHQKYAIPPTSLVPVL